MNLDLIKHQGAMEVESIALDNAFSDTDVKPRQRLLSAVIDYGLDMVDCATVEFIDPDFRVAQAIRTGETKDGEIVYRPWTVRIGYYDQEPEEMTTLTGVPQIEVPTFPESGEPTTKIKIFSASVMLQKNTTPAGSVQCYLEPFKDNPLRQALTKIAEHYGLTLDLGDAGMDKIITEIDEAYKLRHKDLTQFDMFPNDTLSPPEAADWSPPPKIIYMMEDFSREPDETDYSYLKRLTSLITGHVQDGILDADKHYEQYFAANLPGEVSKSDIKVIFGIRGSRLVFKFNYELITELGFKEGIPVVDYRTGNNLLLSFAAGVAAPNAQNSAITTFFNWLFRRNKEATAETRGPLTDVEASPGASAEGEELNVYNVPTTLYLSRTPPSNAAAQAVVSVDDVKRSMETNITGDATLFGIPKLMCGQLIACTGLGWGPQSDLDEKAAADAQLFSCYTRIYLIKQATHKMDSGGFYSLKLKLEGCSLDESEEKALKNLKDRLEAGIESGGSGGSFLSRLLGRL